MESLVTSNEVVLENKVKNVSANRGWDSHVGPVGILKKCCCFSEQFKIQHGCPSLDWLRRFLPCFPKLLHLKSPDFP
jgi:hypothetical protein